jgi:predicted DNA-binding protein YlxM (UPF0122 family)
MQKNLEMDAITIPNVFNNWDYSRAIDFSCKWLKNERLDKPLMAIACNENHAKVIKDNKDKIDCIGINLRKENIPLLYFIRENLKKENIWIHSFMTPRSYSQAEYNGTLGILINFFGVDSISPEVGHPKSSQYFKYLEDKKTPEEKAEEANGNKYFNPKDYSNYNFKYLKEQYGEDYSLSNFCDCEVCEKNSISDIISDFESTFAHSRSHDIFSNIIESHKFHESIVEKNPAKYISQKKYANLILNELQKSTRITDYI